jgi:predicted nucleic acid-binding protein
MNKVFVPDASPLILLQKAGLLAEISPLAQSWVLPEGVIAEIECQRPIEPFLGDLGKNAEVLRRGVEYVSPLVAGWDLGRGESDVLTLAMSFPRAWAVLDDLQARKCAEIQSTRKKEAKKRIRAKGEGEPAVHSPAATVKK